MARDLPRPKSDPRHSRTVSSQPQTQTERRRALIALALMAPVPTLGTAAAMIFIPGPVGQALFMAAKIWLIAFPAFWYLVIEHGKPSWSPATEGGLGVGVLTGLIAGAHLEVGILDTYWTALGFDLLRALCRIGRHRNIRIRNGNKR